MNRCRGRFRALAAWVMDCVPTEHPAWSYFVLAAAILVAGQVSAQLERKASEPPVPDSLQAGCAHMGAAAVELRAGYRQVEPHLNLGDVSRSSSATSARWTAARPRSIRTAPNSC